MEEKTAEKIERLYQNWRTHFGREKGDEDKDRIAILAFVEGYITAILEKKHGRNNQDSKTI